MKTYKELSEGLCEAKQDPRIESITKEKADYNDGAQYWVILNKGYNYDGQHQFAERTKKDVAKNMKSVEQCPPDCGICYHGE